LKTGEVKRGEQERGETTWYLQRCGGKNQNLQKKREVKGERRLYVRDNVKLQNTKFVPITLTGGGAEGGCPKRGTKADTGDSSGGAGDFLRKIHKAKFFTRRKKRKHGKNKRWEGGEGQPET